MRFNFRIRIRPYSRISNSMLVFINCRRTESFCGPDSSVRIRHRIDINLLIIRQSNRICFLKLVYGRIRLCISLIIHIARKTIKNCLRKSRSICRRKLVNRSIRYSFKILIRPCGRIGNRMLVFVNCRLSESFCGPDSSGRIDRSVGIGLLIIRQSNRICFLKLIYGRICLCISFIVRIARETVKDCLRKSGSIRGHELIDCRIDCCRF